MVGGVTVGFAPPSMDGTDSGTLVPAAADPALAATGTDALPLGALGMGLATVGVAFLVMVRRRRVTGRQLQS
jgi:LPXTG-motif cell wall-anchored protein